MTRPATSSADGTDAVPGDPLVAELVVAVSRMYRRVRSERADGDLGDAALGVLSYLQKNGPRTLSELSEIDRVTPASMSQTVNRLAALGYAVRERDPQDGRKVLFSPTDDGRALAIRERARRHAWMGARLRELSDTERGTLAEAARLLRGIADSER